MSKSEDKAMVAPVAETASRGKGKAPRAQNGCVGGKPISKLPNFGTSNNNKMFEPEIQPSVQTLKELFEEFKMYRKLRK